MARDSHGASPEWCFDGRVGADILPHRFGAAPETMSFAPAPSVWRTEFATGAG